MKIKNYKVLPGAKAFRVFSLAATALAVISTQSQAAFITGTASSSDITNISSGSLIGQAGGFEGNDSNNQLAVMAALDGILNGDWSYDGANKSDASGNGVFTSNPGGSSGTLTFDSPMFGIFAVSIKASNFYSLYAFDGGTFGVDSGIKSFDFTTIGAAIDDKKKNKSPGLSHASFYSFPSPPTGGGGRVPDGGTTLVSLGVALLGLGSMRRLIAAKA